MENKERTKRCLGALFGQAIGDALGVHDEFKSAKAIASVKRDRLQYVETSRMGNPWPAGEWSDDTEQALCILDAYEEDAYLGANTLARHFKRWLDEDGRGCGGHTLLVLGHPMFLVDPIGVAHAGWDESDRWAAPNGAVMRVSAVGTLRPWDLNWTERAAVLSAQVTHYDPRCVASSVAVAVAVACLVSGAPIHDAIAEAVRRASSYHHEAESFMGMSLEELQLDESMDDPEIKHTPIGYTYKCLGAGFYALRKLHSSRKDGWDPPEAFTRVLDVILRAGGDVDTNAAVAGALMGAHVGVGSLPEHLVQGLVGKKRILATYSEILKLNAHHIQGA